MSSACPTPLTEVPVTRPLSVWGPRGSAESQVAGALGDTQTEPLLDQVLRERDEAIAKKRAVEAELDTCKAKLRAVEAQLLEVLEEKLRLKQEVEAWEMGKWRQMTFTRGRTGTSGLRVKVGGQVFVLERTFAALSRNGSDTLTPAHRLPAEK
ncbi:uncharacterized protein LOC106509660 isoform X1 [Sus scrofa]|uniref:uncharacterized protein LOC106509660 isoform X1 n=1 Tax=Sus scrofa TaxID=9823 RepID=UPI0006B1F737|nr:uncharacterized protein LOC106509660 isoform X1 [Sus scrofa]